MIKSEKFHVKSNAVKTGKTFDMFGLVKTLVRNTELSNALEKTSFKDGKHKIEDAYTSVDIMTVDESKVRSVLGNDTDDFIKARKEIIELQKEVKNCLPIEQVTSLCLTDRVHITLMARVIYKNIKLESWIFDTENGGVDISKAIQSYYKDGNLKNTKELLRPIFNKLLGTEGEYFYAVKTKRADFADADLRNFFASFGGSAKCEEKKTKKDGQEIITFKDFNYIDKSDNKKIQIIAFTTLCAVVLDNASKHTVIKPEKEVAEKSESETK